MIKLTTLKSIVPNGIEVRNNEKGMNMVATKPFKRGQVVYTASWVEIRGETTDYDFTLEFVDEKENHLTSMICNTHTHGVKCGNIRQIFGFDGFMNHSCDANTYSVLVKELTYDTVAIYDINPGDEITCNYVLFDYECNGHQFECLCGSKNCYGIINGFKGLSLTQQVDLLSFADNSIKQDFLQDHPEIILVEDNELPNTLEIAFIEGRGYHLVAKQAFPSGEVMYTNTITKIKGKKTIIMKINQQYKLLHHKGDETMFRYFDTFSAVDESDNIANCIPKWVDKKSYQIIAKSNINAGDIIACDWNAMDKDDKLVENNKFCSLLWF